MDKKGPRGLECCRRTLLLECSDSDSDLTEVEPKTPQPSIHSTPSQRKGGGTAARPPSRISLATSQTAAATPLPPAAFKRRREELAAVSFKE